MTPQPDPSPARREWRDRMLPPAWRTRWDDARRQASARWQRMTRREQRMVQALAAVLTVWLVAQLLVLPAWRDVVRHSGALPALRAQAANPMSLARSPELTWPLPLAWALSPSAGCLVLPSSSSQQA